jgi:hypothetical protein
LGFSCHEQADKCTEFSELLLQVYTLMNFLKAQFLEAVDVIIIIINVNDSQ